MKLDCQFYRRAGVGKIKINEECEAFTWNFYWKGWLKGMMLIRAQVKRNKDIFLSSIPSEPGNGRILKIKSP